MTHLSLFSGIGGLDVAAQWAGFQTVGLCEYADYPYRVLQKRFPGVPIWRDIRTLTGEDFYERTGLRTVDVVSGDFPASPFPSPGSEKAETTTVISGRRCAGLYPRSGPLGSSEKTYLDLFEAYLMKYLTISKRRDTPRGHTLSRLVRPEPCSREKGSLLWPRPTTGAPLCGGTHNFRQMTALRDAGIITEEERRNLTQGNGGRSNPALMEWLMGFPIGWTDLNVSETR